MNIAILIPSLSGGGAERVAQRIGIPEDYIINALSKVAAAAFFHNYFTDPVNVSGAHGYHHVAF